MSMLNNLKVQQESGGQFWHTGLFQAMPGRRIRVNPEGIPDLACWLIAVSQEWEGVLKRTHAGLSATQRAALRGQKQYARHALVAVGKIILRMAETVKASDFEAACEMWRKGCEEAIKAGSEKRVSSASALATRKGG